MRANVVKVSSLQLPFIILALICAALAALLVSVSSMMAAQYDDVVNELNEVRSLLSAEPSGVIESSWVNDRLTVLTASVHENSLILITPVSEPVGRWWVGEITPGESFTVFSSAGDETMRFQWFIVDRR